MVATKAARRTAAAETSLATRASFLISGLTRLTIDSIAVLKSSKTMTKEIANRRTIHSQKENFRIIARPSVVMAKRVCVRKFGSFLSAVLRPSIAKPKLVGREYFLLILILNTQYSLGLMAEQAMC